MKIGVVSDTHGHIPYTRDAIYMLQSFEVEQVIHCGDIGGPEIVELFHHWKTHFVLGNVDEYPEEIKKSALEQGHNYYERFGELNLESTKIALLHGDDTKRLDKVIQSGHYDLVCHGHTHQSKVERVGQTLVLNPGALYRARPHSIAIVELPALDAKIIEVSS
ncbi:MAG: YfcE family phosphodiesterase [Blastopirellula sp.]|nr:MAG: YfcE family phosphodiesterase [Blastopirellula sp.]